MDDDLSIPTTRKKAAFITIFHRPGQAANYIGVTLFGKSVISKKLCSILGLVENKRMRVFTKFLDGQD